MNDTLIKVAGEIAQDIVRLAQVIMEDNGITSDSRLHRNITANVSLDGNIVIETLFDNYIEYIENGRATGKRPPIDALREWALRKGIAADNGTLYAIANAIARDGIQPRPILATLEQEIQQLFEKEWADKLFEALTEELTKYFNN